MRYMLGVVLSGVPDGPSTSDKCQIFYYVLSFKSWDEQRGPDFSHKEEWKGSCEHVYCK